MTLPILKTSRQSYCFHRPLSLGCSTLRVAQDSSKRPNKLGALWAQGPPNIKLSSCTYTTTKSAPHPCYCKNVCTQLVSYILHLLSTASRAPSLCRRRAIVPAPPAHPRTPAPSDEIDHPPLSTPTPCDYVAFYGCRDLTYFLL